MGKPEKVLFKKLRGLFSSASEPEDPERLPAWKPRTFDGDEADRIRKRAKSGQPFAHVPFDELD